LKGSVFFIAQYDFVTKVTRQRKKRLLKKALFLSLLCHTFFIAAFIFIAKPFLTNKEVTPQLIEITEAPYVPLQEKEVKNEAQETMQDVPEKDKAEIKAVEKKEAPKEDVVEKKEFRIPERKRPDPSWRSKVEKEFTKPAPKKIVISRSDIEYKKQPYQDVKSTQPTVPASYIRMIGFLIKSHWYIPEDLGHKFYGLSAELDVTIDAIGTIKKVEIASSSGNNLFDYYAKEAVLKTGKLPLPPKEILETIFLNGKITIEFKP